MSVLNWSGRISVFGSWRGQWKLACIHHKFVFNHRFVAKEASKLKSRIEVKKNSWAIQVKSHHYFRIATCGKAQRPKARTKYFRFPVISWAFVHFGCIYDNTRIAGGSLLSKWSSWMETSSLVYKWVTIWLSKFRKQMLENCLHWKILKELQLRNSPFWSW